MRLRSYLSQRDGWPHTGRHILAQYDDEAVVVYQAYRKEIGHYAAKHQRFGGEFSFSRMSWIKPNFLWMMYRSGWGEKEGQEVTLAITIRRGFFDELLCAAVQSTFTPDLHLTPEAWREAVALSDVRLQWDPDHDPLGAPEQRRAIQLGLRGRMLRRYATEEITRIEDISDFVAAQRVHARTAIERLEIPEVKVYRPRTDSALRAIRLDEEKSAKLK